jgi:PLP dependent protein
VNTCGRSDRIGLRDKEELANLASYIIDKCPSLNLYGLFCIAAAPSAKSILGLSAIDEFSTLRNLKLYLEAFLYENYAISTTLRLSMGMSEDYQDAIACHSNFLRIGSAIFGPRSPYNSIQSI